MRKIIKCKQCNVDFEVPDNKRNKNRAFCSGLCAKKHNGLKNKGKKHIERQTPLISIECKQCHIIFDIKYKHRNRQFCCKPCSDVYLSGDNNPSKRPDVRKKISDRVKETHWDSSGDKNPKWKGGTSTSFTYYGGKFTNKLKKIIRERDGYLCQLCGAKKSNQVHHKDYDKSNCSEDNLITLCIKCHGGCHGRINEERKSDITKLFMEV